MPLSVIAAAIGSGTATATTAAINTTGVKAFLVFVVTQSPNNPTVSDSRGNVWRKKGNSNQFNVAFTGTLSCWETATLPNTSTAHTFTAVGTGLASIWVVGILPTHSSNRIIASAWSSVADPTSPYTSGVISPAAAESLLIGYGCTDGSGNPITVDWSSSSFTDRASVPDQANFWGGSVASKNVSVNGNYSAQFTDNSTGPLSSAVGITAFTELPQLNLVRVGRRSNRRDDRWPLNAASGFSRRVSLGGQFHRWLLFNQPSVGGGGLNYTLGASGSIAFSGTAALIKSKVLAASGTVAFTGSAALRRTKVLQPSGTIGFSGSATLLKTRVLGASGQIVLSGTAPLTFVPGAGSLNYTLSAGGSVVFSGSAPLLKTRVLAAGGSVNFLGTASLLKTRVLGAGGSIQFAGTAPLIKTRVLGASGQIVFSGSAPLIFVPAGAPPTTDSRQRQLTGFGT